MAYALLARFCWHGDARDGEPFTVTTTAAQAREAKARPHWDLGRHESERLVFAGRGTIWNWHNGQPRTPEGFFARFQADYETGGVDFLKGLTGQFGYVVYDKRTQQLYAFRDQLGFYPLYFMVQDETLWVAAQMKALTAVKREKQLSLLALVSFFKLGYVLAPDTPIKGIGKLLPGEYIACGPEGRLSHHRYWRPSAMQPKNQSHEAFVAEARDVMETAVTRHLNGSDNVALFLSGGLDSAVLASILATKKDVRMQSYSFGLGVVRKRVDYQRDLPYARRAAQHFDIPHQEVVLAADFPIVAELLKAIPIYDGLQITPNVITKAHLLQRARADHFDTIMTGSASTPAFQVFPLEPLRRKLPSLDNQQRVAFGMLARVLRENDSTHRLFPETRIISQEQLVATLDPYVYDTSIVTNLDDFQAGVAPALISEKMIAAHLPMMTAHGGVLRMPYYDMFLWRYRQGVPNELRGGTGAYPFKHLLIEAFRDKLPNDIFTRKKTGYPSYYWYRGELHTLQNELFSASLRHYFPFLDVAAAEQFIKDERLSSRKSTGKASWGLTVFLLWYLHFVEGLSLDGLL